MVVEISLHRLVCNRLFPSITGEELNLFTGGMVADNTYVYSEDLLALDSCWEPQATSQAVISREIYTPLHWLSWAHGLVDHPDLVFTGFILSGIRGGFRIGFHRDQSLMLAGRNLYCPRPLLVSDYLSREVQLSRIWNSHLGFSPGKFI